MHPFIPLLAATLLTACAAPKPVFDPRIWSVDEQKQGFTYRDFTLAQLECERLTDQHNKQIMLGNWGGRETNRIFTTCMAERGFKAANGREIVERY